MRQNNFADNCREGGGVQQHQGVAARYQKTQARVDVLWWWGNKRDLREQIRSVSSRITPRISLKKERMSELATWHQSGIIPSDVFFFLLLPERPQDVPPACRSEKKVGESSLDDCKKKKKKERNRTHAVNLNLITLHEIRYRLVFQMTMKRSLPRWLGIYTSYCYSPPSSVPTMDAIIWNDCRAYDVEICIDDKQ